MWPIALTLAIGVLGVLWMRWNRTIDRWIKDANSEYATLRAAADEAIEQPPDNFPRSDRSEPSQNSSGL